MTARLRHASDGMVLAASTLAANAILSAGLGVAYWFLAARLWDPEVVGVNSALIAGMTLAASVSEVGMKNALVRFVPVAGRVATRLVGSIYAIAIAISTVTALIAAVWSRRSDAAAGIAALSVVGFVLATVVWAIFVLEDSVLTGSGRTSWVLASNTVYNVAKVGLLVLLAAVGTQIGIFLSWVLPLIVIVIVVNGRLFARRPTETDDHATPPTVREITRYMGSDAVASVVWRAVTRGMPLLVVAVAGTEATAHYHLAWSMGYIVYLLVSSVGEAVVASAAAGRPRADLLTRTVALDLAIVAPAGLAVALLAHPIMSVFGASYAEGGTTALRWIGLSAIPYAVTGSVVAVARVQQRLRLLMGTYLGLSTLVAAGAVVLGNRDGVAGIGLAWFIAQSVVAAILFVLHPELWGTRLVRGPILRLRERLRRSRHRQRIGERAIAAVSDDFAGGVEWIHSTSTMTVAGARLRSEGRQTVRVVRVATSAEGAAAVAANATALRAIAENDDLREWRRLTPVLRDVRSDGDRPTTVESCLPGITMDALLRRGMPRGPLVDAALRAIEPLHRATVSVVPIDPAVLDEFVTAPVDELGRMADLRPWRDDLRRLDDLLRRDLEGRELHLGMVHGDYGPRNILFDESTGEVSGIIDWERSAHSTPVVLDEVGIRLTSEMFSDGVEFGTVVTRHLDDTNAATGPTRTEILLAWLTLSAGNRRREQESRPSRLWLTRNVHPVLEATRTLADELAVER